MKRKTLTNKIKIYEVTSVTVDWKIKYFWITQLNFYSDMAMLLKYYF